MHLEDLTGLNKTAVLHSFFSGPVKELEFSRAFAILLSTESGPKATKLLSSEGGTQ